MSYEQMLSLDKSNVKRGVKARALNRLSRVRRSACSNIRYPQSKDLFSGQQKLRWRGNACTGPRPRHNSSAEVRHLPGQAGRCAQHGQAAVHSRLLRGVCAAVAGGACHLPRLPLRVPRGRHPDRGHSLRGMLCTRPAAVTMPPSHISLPPPPPLFLSLTHTPFIPFILPIDPRCAEPVELAPKP